MDSRASIIRDNARLSAENSNLSRRTCSEKNWWQKSAAFEIVFVVARSRRGWNFNNYSLDFPGVPLGFFAKKRNGRICALYSFPAIHAKAIHTVKWKLVGRRINCDWNFTIREEKHANLHFPYHLLRKINSSRINWNLLKLFIWNWIINAKFIHLRMEKSDLNICHNLNT